MQPLHIAFYQPEIPQNVGAAIRLAACLNVGMDIIHPCGFPWDERKIRQSALDYWQMLSLHKHESWSAFQAAYAQPKRRVILMSTKAAVSYTEFEFQTGDILLAGQESAGVPEDIHSAVHARVFIPMADGARSLNVVNATSMIAGEALRQIALRGKEAV